MNHSAGLRLLFLAPQLYGANGGIQASGKMAWEGIAAWDGIKLFATETRSHKEKRKYFVS